LRNGEHGEHAERNRAGRELESAVGGPAGDDGDERRAAAPRRKRRSDGERRKQQADEEQAAEDRVTVVSAVMTSATLETNKGTIELELYEEDAPKTVSNFVELAKKGFYDGVVFHRVIEDFMVQGGDPTGTGTGGPGYQFEDEINDHRVERGALAMANAGPNTNGSQFFIVTAAACPWLDGKHTVFGRVRSGMDVVDEISRAPRDARDRPLDDVRIESVEIAG
jgi:cyclophilin family peptidyl-prolyl cis-trans isomerase